MACGYLKEESIGFLNEYMSEYTPTTKRAWDADEEPAMYDEILEGGKCERPMSMQFRKLIHSFVLDNTEHMKPYQRCTPLVCVKNCWCTMIELTWNSWKVYIVCLYGLNV